MKTTRNPPSSSSQSSEAELAFCGDIILTPLFFFSLFLFSFLPSLSVFSHPRDEHSPIPLYSAKDTSNEDDYDRQTDSQTNKQTNAPRCAARYGTRSKRTYLVSFLFLYIIYRVVGKNRRRIGLNLSLSLFFSLSLSLSSKGGKYDNEEDAKRGEFAPSPSRLCVCVCLFV